jgi:hypothetical protein
LRARELRLGWRQRLVRLGWRLRRRLLLLLLRRWLLLLRFRRGAGGGAVCACRHTTHKFWLPVGRCRLVPLARRFDQPARKQAALEIGRCTSPRRHFAQGQQQGQGQQ